MSDPPATAVAKFEPINGRFPEGKPIGVGRLIRLCMVNSLREADISA